MLIHSVWGEVAGVVGSGGGWQGAGEGQKTQKSSHYGLNDDEDGVVIVDGTLGCEVVLSAFGGVVKVGQGLIGWLPAKH